MSTGPTLWLPAPSSGPQLESGQVHVWRVALTDQASAEAHRRVLSAEEQRRADRFHRGSDSSSFTIAHGALREVLARYTVLEAAAIEFGFGPNGKPGLNSEPSPRVQFNLSHSGDWALIAVCADAAVGVDVERWDAQVECVELAEQFFSVNERLALRSLPKHQTIEGFFSAWSRKEAYLKATGAGITGGLHHFDVQLTPGAPAGLLADRTDVDAATRWRMYDCAVAHGYSAAVVVEASHCSVSFFDFAQPF